MSRPTAIWSRARCANLSEVVAHSLGVERSSVRRVVMEPKREIDMDENRISGTARNVVGKVEKGLGRAAGDASSEFKGKPMRPRAQPKILRSDS